MHRGGGAFSSRCHRRAWITVASLVATALAGCSGGRSDPAAPAARASGTVAGTATSAPPVSVEAATDATTTTVAFEAASDGPRSAPQVGTGTSLLRSVRVGRHDDFERIVLEFDGKSRPGYRIRWFDGPVVADGSGEPVDVEGDAHLEVVLEPASGVDPDTGTPTYEGPDRIAMAGRTRQITDLVRTGDFEAVLTWVAGAAQRSPFRVLTLGSPTRLVIDLQTD